MIDDAGGTAEFFPCDVAGPEDNRALVDARGRDVTAGSTSRTTTPASACTPRSPTPTDEDFDRVIAVNLRGTFLGMKHQIRPDAREGAPAGRS